MKSLLLTALAALISLMTFSVASPCQEQLLFRVNVPFNFVAGGVPLSAGEYLAFHKSSTLIQLVRKDGRGSAWVWVKPSPAASGETTNQIVFNRYGDSYFLSQVRTRHDQQIHECYQCRAEKNLLAQYPPSDVKTVALNVSSAK